MQFDRRFQTVKTAGLHLIPMKNDSKNAHPSSILKWITVGLLYEHVLLRWLWAKAERSKKFKLPDN
jgi:hypothetical protein